MASGRPNHYPRRLTQGRCAAAQPPHLFPRLPATREVQGFSPAGGLGCHWFHHCLAPKGRRRGRSPLPGFQGCPLASFSILESPLPSGRGRVVGPSAPPNRKGGWQGSSPPLHPFCLSLYTCGIISVGALQRMLCKTPIYNPNHARRSTCWLCAYLGILARYVACRMTATDA
jgi:hypothetical protein